MRIFDEIEEARKHKDSLRYGAVGYTYATRGPRQVGKVTEFYELEDAAREAMEEYLSARPSRVGDGLERRACGAVLSYLLAYSHDLESCTEYAVSQRFGLPRARVKRLLSRMEWDGVLESMGVGISSPYRVINLGKAMGEGYLKLGLVEAEKLVKIAHPPWVLVDLVKSSLVPSLPDAETITEAKITIENVLNPPDQEIEAITAFFHPGRVDHYLPIHDPWVVNGFLIAGGLFSGELANQVLMELGVPERVTSREVKAGLRKVAEKYLRLMRIRVNPLLGILGEHGFEKGKKLIRKAYLRDMLLGMETDEKGRPVPVRRSYREDKVITSAVVVPGHGDVSLQTQEITPTHIALVASIYRAALRFAEKVGADTQLLKICRQEATQLESYVEAQPETLSVEEAKKA